MTVTREHAQMLTALAIACRPHRAPTWDAEGVMAAIGRVKDRALPEVALAVIRAAADRDAVNPGVIPSNGSHWQEQLKPEKWQPDVVPKHERCTVCSLSEARCKQLQTGNPDLDHEFVSAIQDRRLPADAITSVVGELRDHLQPTTPRPEPQPKPETTDERTSA